MLELTSDAGDSAGVGADEELGFGGLARVDVPRAVALLVNDSVCPRGAGVDCFGNSGTLISPS